MSATFIGAMIGLFTGGPVGLLVGGFVGYLVGAFARGAMVGSLQVAQGALVDSIFSIMGALCKADNVVTRDEIDAAERMFDMLRLNETQHRQAKTAFGAGKQPGFDLDAAVDQFAALSRGRAPLLQLFMQLQTMAVAADGHIHPAEHAMLVRIARRLGLSEQDVAQLEALLRSAATGGSAGQAPASSSQLSDAYKALGISADATPAEIKRAYRRLISKNHPDKLAARGLPESMRAVAEERSRELNAAYDLIKEARGIV